MELRLFYSHSGTSFLLTRFIILSLFLKTVLAANVYGVQSNGDTPQTSSAMIPGARPGPSTTTILSIILVLSLILIPILLAILSRILYALPFLFQVPKSTIARVSRRFSSLRHQLLTPLLPTNLLPRRFTTAIGNPPTSGITLYLALIAVVTFVLTFIKPRYRTPNIPSPALATDPILTYIFQRTGTYAFALLPVIILFSSRNNLILLLGNRLPLAQAFSHSTYLVLHRWIGRICALFAVVHSTSQYRYTCPMFPAYTSLHSGYGARWRPFPCPYLSF
ncbi:hypothetical protein V8F06_014847 [Rhypophila decipiens]